VIRAARWAALGLVAMFATNARARADDAAPPLAVDLGRGDRVLAGVALQLRATAAGDDEGAVRVDVALPRVRPGLRGVLLDRRLTLAVTLNTSPTALELIEAWSEIELARPWLRIRVGQWKVPFTRYRGASFSDLVLVDWARTVTVPFGAEHAIGVAASGTVAGVGTRWDVGLFTGAPSRAAHGTGLAACYGERIEYASALGSLHGIDSVHPELAFRVSQALGERAEAGGGVLLSLSIAGDLAPEPRRDLALRMAPELHARIGVASAHLILYAGLAPIGDDPLAPALLGALAELDVPVTQDVELAVRFARTARTGALQADARAHAGRAVVDAPPDEREAVATRHARTGRVDAEQEVAIGVRWSVVGRTVALQGDAAWLTEEGEHGVAHGWRLRLQTQLVL
jgi:hypothetical protein